MTLTYYLIIGVIAIIIGLAILYIIHAKKSGQKCVGCPHSKTCGSNGCHEMHKKSDYCSCDRNKL